MKKALLLASISICCTLAFTVSGQGGAKDAKETKKPITSQVVVPAKGVKTFTVTGKSTQFRLTAFVISGGSIDAPVIKGNAVHLRTNEILTVGKNGEPLIGSRTKEFVFRGTGTGQVSITIKKMFPTSPMPVIERYQVTIK